MCVENVYNYFHDFIRPVKYTMIKIKITIKNTWSLNFAKCDKLTSGLKSHIWRLLSYVILCYVHITTGQWNSKPQMVIPHLSLMHAHLLSQYSSPKYNFNICDLLVHDTLIEFCRPFLPFRGEDRCTNG